MVELSLVNKSVLMSPDFLLDNKRLVLILELLNQRRIASQSICGQWVFFFSVMFYQGWPKVDGLVKSPKRTYEEVIKVG